jgi:hypothetical protein
MYQVVCYGTSDLHDARLTRLGNSREHACSEDGIIHQSTYAGKYPWRSLVVLYQYVAWTRVNRHGWDTVYCKLRPVRNRGDCS